MRRREIDPDFWADERVGALPPLARLLFVGLWCAADREGRIGDPQRKLWAEILPYDAWDGGETFQALLDSRLVLAYDATGRTLLWIPAFRRRQHVHPREAPSTLPPHPNDQGTPKADQGAPRASQGEPRLALVDRGPAKALFPSGSSGPSVPPPEGECAHARPPLVDARASGEPEGSAGGNVDNQGSASAEPPDHLVLARWWHERYLAATGTHPTLSAKAKLLLAQRCLEHGLAEVRRRLSEAMQRGATKPRLRSLLFALSDSVWDELGAPAPADRPAVGLVMGAEIDIAWRAVVARAAKIGARESPTWDDQVLARAVRAVGWGAICRASPGDPAMRSRFGEAYQEARTAATAEEGAGG